MQLMWHWIHVVVVVVGLDSKFILAHSIGQQSILFGFSYLGVEVLIDIISISIVPVWGYCSHFGSILEWPSLVCVCGLLGLPTPHLHC